MSASDQRAIIFMGPLSSGGAEKQALLLAKTLHNDLNITVVSYYGNVRLPRMVQFAEDEKIVVEYLLGNALQKVWRFHMLLRRIRPNIMFMYLPSNNLIGGVLGRLHGVEKLFGGIRSSRLPKFHFRILYLANNFLNHRTIYNNHEGFRHLTSQGLDPKKGIVIHNCFHPFAKPIRREKIEPVRILTCARFEHYKDHETAIAAFAHVAANTEIDVVFRIVGSGTMKEQVLEWISKYNVFDKVELIENPDNVETHYRESHIYLCSSTYEGLSNSVMEAMNHCLPVVSTRVGDHDHLVVEGSTGYLVEVGDRDVMAERLSLLISNHETRLAMGANGHAHLISHFSLEHFRGQYLDLINSLDRHA